MFTKQTKEKYSIISMAYSRAEFKNKVEEKVGGAFFEYLKAACAKSNKETKWVEHWNSEVTRLLDSELVVVLLHTASFKNKRKAAQETVEIVKKLKDKYYKSAKNQLELNYFKKSMAKDVSEKTISSFFNRVENIIDQNT